MMPTKIKISIIVPFFNSEKCLKKCIESIISQDYPIFELILVDDGSQDNGLNICKEFAKNDKRIIIVQQNNGGVSSARNSGLKKATGDAVIFVDSDDWIEQGYLSEINRTFFCADLIIFGVRFHFLDRDIVTVPSKENKKYTRKNFLNSEEFYSFKSSISTPCSKVFKLKFIQENHLNFDTDMTFAEDSLFIIKYLSNIESICLNNNWFYNTNKTNQNSITHNYLPRQAENRCKYVNEADKLFSVEMNKSTYNHFLLEQFYNLISSISYVFLWSNERNERIRVIKIIGSNSFLFENKPRGLKLRFKIIVWLLRKKHFNFLYKIFDLRIRATK